MLATLAIPALAGFLVTGTALGALTGLLWGGLVRIFFVHHVTWSVNSVCHFLGSRRFDTDDRSTNVFWLALPSLGESWHHNHHAFPRSAVHGLKRWEPDPSAMIIAGDGEAGPRPQRGPHLARAPGRTHPPRRTDAGTTGTVLHSGTVLHWNATGFTVAIWVSDPDGR